MCQFKKKIALNNLGCTNTSSKVELKSIQLIHELMFQAGIKGMSEQTEASSFLVLYRYIDLVAHL